MPTLSSYTIPPLKKKIHFLPYPFPCLPSPKSEELGHWANSLGWIWEMKGRVGGRGPASGKSEREPSAARAVSRSARCPRRARSGPARRFRGPEAGAGRGWGWGPGPERGRSSAGPLSPPLFPAPHPHPFYIFFFLPSSLASLSPLGSEGASRLGAGAGYVSETVTCSLPVSFSCVLK